MTVTSPSAKDYGEIDDLLLAAFGGRDEINLMHGLRRAGEIAIELVGTEQGRVIGHIAFSPMDGPVKCLALAPVAVLPKWQSRGVGSALIRRGLDTARQDGWQAVFVLGAPAYYERFEFSVDLAAPFQSPYAGDHFMALELVENCLFEKSGVVRHASTFATLEG